MATLGLSLQVPIAVTMDMALRDPSWLHHVLSACLTMGGAVLVLGGVIGINLVSGEEEALPEGEEGKAAVPLTEAAPERQQLSQQSAW